jgi:hypothetical protein
MAGDAILHSGMVGATAVMTLTTLGRSRVGAKEGMGDKDMWRIRFVSPPQDSAVSQSSLSLPQVDGNSLGHGGICGNTVAPIVPTPILLQAVAADGHTLIGAPVTLLDNNGISDSGVIEAPSLVKAADGTYVLFYSRDCYSSVNYTVSYATASSVAGPYTTRADLLEGGVPGEDGGAMNLTGTGGADVLWDGVHMGMWASCVVRTIEGMRCANMGDK